MGKTTVMLSLIYASSVHDDRDYPEGLPRAGPESPGQRRFSGIGTAYLVEQALVDQRRQHLPLRLRHVGAREVLADGGLGDAAAFDDAAFFVAIQCFVG